MFRIFDINYLMDTHELQNTIIKKILNTNDKQLLQYFDDLLSIKNKNSEAYKLTDFEKQIIKESLSDYKKGNIVSNEDVFKKTDKWLEE